MTEGLDNQRFTQTQQRILDKLADGLPHPRDELITCLVDPKFSSPKHLNYHLTIIRKVLRPKGSDIICELVHRKISYRHVRLLASATDGYR